MKLSQPLSFLKAIINHELSQVNFEITIYTKNLDWLEFERLVNYHSIRPLVNSFFKKNNYQYLPEELAKNLQKYAFDQTLFNLQSAQISNQLLALLKENNIKALPYKGTLFVNKIYENTQLREGSDIDLLVEPQNAKKGIMLLMKEGYKVSLCNYQYKHVAPETLIDEILATPDMYECSLKNEQMQIDFHFGVSYGFLPYKIQIEDYFNGAEEGELYRQKTLLPSAENMFWMMMLHHGGKEFWLRYKHVVDLIFFLKKYEKGINWNSILDQARAYHLYENMLTGFQVLKEHFNYEPPVPIALALEERPHFNMRPIEDYWEYAKKWDHLKGRLKYEKILWLHMPADKSKIGHYYNLLKSYSVPHPVEHSRIIIFPKNWYFMNTIAKLFSYVFGKKTAFFTVPE